MVFADIDAGTGIFTKAAAKITRAPIYAIDPSASIREILQSNLCLIPADKKYV